MEEGEQNNSGNDKESNYEDDKREREVRWKIEKNSSEDKKESSCRGDKKKYK